MLPRRLLIHTCNIQEKTASLDGYEQVDAWSDTAVDVPCRHSTDKGVSISDSNIRINTDDDIFNFQPDVEIVRGNRIVFEEENYDVIKVNNASDATGVHHIVVRARKTDNA
jgi:hypothetical protein